MRVDRRLDGVLLPLAAAEGGGTVVCWKRGARSIGICLLLVLYASATEAQTAEQMLGAADPATARAIEADPRLREAVVTIAAGSRIAAPELARVLRNPHVTTYVQRALPALVLVRDVEGVERVAHRLATANSLGRAHGATFELETGAALRDRLRELSADVNGHEVDALLHDGTIVEAKAFPRRDPRLREEMLHRAVEQLEVRAGDGATLMLFVNAELSAAELGHVASHLGGGIEVRVGTPGRPVVVQRRALASRSRGLGAGARVGLPRAAERSSTGRAPAKLHPSRVRPRRWIYRTAPSPRRSH
jgi:hypothetical protein